MTTLAFTRLGPVPLSGRDVSRPARFGTLLLAATLLHACAPAPAPASPTPVVPPSEHAPEPARIEVPPAPPAPPRAPVRLAFVGDINLGTLTVAGGVPPDSGRALLAGARSALTGDFVVGNFEGVLADSGTTIKCGKEPLFFGPPELMAEFQKAREEKMRAAKRKAPPRPRKPRAPQGPPPKPTCYAFLTPTMLAPRLKEAGFTHLNLANNHASDFGLPGRESTQRALDSLGLVTYGPLDRIVVDTVRRNGRRTIVAIVGFTTYPYAYDLLDVAASARVIDSLRRGVDLLVVTFHGGAEGLTALHVPDGPELLGKEERGDLRLWTHAVIDAGADLVVGHGPHVWRGIEWYRGRPIAYSTGNFLNYRGFSLDGPLGVTGVLQVAFDETGLAAHLRLVPMVQYPRTGPRPDPAGTAIDLVRRLSAEDFGPRAARIGEDGTILPPEEVP